MREPPPFKESEIEFIELDCHGLIALAETTVHHDDVVTLASLRTHGGGNQVKT